MRAVTFFKSVCFALACGWFVLAATKVQAQSGLGDIGIAGGIGIFIPTDSEVRNLVGNSFVRFTISPRRMQQFGDQPRFTVEFDIISASRNNNRFLVVPITVGVTQIFGHAEDVARPFGSLRAGVAYMDYAITRPFFSANRPPGRYSSRSFGLAASAQLGIQITDRARVSASYFVFSPSSGFRFDGLSFEASYTLIRL